MPKWMHDRADRIMADNPSMPKGEAFGIATQQMHALGKSPKGYGTAAGKATAKAKYPTPGDDQKTASAFVDELTKIALMPGAGMLGQVGNALKSPAIREHGTELAGLGILAAPGLDVLQSRARARMAGDTSPGAAEHRQLMGETGHALADVGGLGVLMGPEASKLRTLGRGGAALLKHGGAVDIFKNLAMTDIPGTKPWILGNAAKATANATKGALKPSSVSGTRRIGNNVWDVSHMAKKMGVV